MGVIITGFIFLNPKTEPADDILIEQKNIEKPSQAMPGTTSPLSEKELAALWANGRRCPEESFIAHPDPNQRNWLPTDGVSILFDDSATCEDVEQIAYFLSAQIIGYDPHHGIKYGFRGMGWTEDDINAAILKVESLRHPKILKVFRYFSTILE